MSKLKTIEYIVGDNYTIEAIKILQKYFHADWQFAKKNFIYYIDPESNITMCKPESIKFTENYKYIFKQITFKTIKEYVDRLQKQEIDLTRRDQQPTSRIQCTSSKATIASGHLEYRTINFRGRSKAKIGKANLSF